MVFFEAPHRLEETLLDMREILGERCVTLLREMTKVHEEIIHGEIGHLLEKIGKTEIKGEITLIIEGTKLQKKDQGLDKDTEKEMKELIMHQGLGVKETAKRISGKTGFPYRRLYKRCLSLKKALDK
jgi:16S rRNA (cytidine1402-2'-O)-methyltransferase